MRNDILTDEILAVLKDRDLLTKRDTIESALNDPTTGRQTEEWVVKHLNPSTLLSREELVLYDKLKSSGALQPILRDPKLGTIRPFLEEEIRSAIESLEASTAAIQRQTETLSFQCEIIRKQLRQKESWEQDRSRETARLRQKHESGRQSTAIAANDLSDELEASFRSAADMVGAENKRILASLSSRLKQDDKNLAEMESLISGIKLNGNDASTVKRASQLSALLAEYNAEEIHYRLDRLYLEGVLSGPSISDPATAGSETVTVLEEELESLYPEIEILAEMSSKQQFYEPILREMHHQHDQLRAASEQKLERALDVLFDMTHSTESLTQRLHERESSCELLEQLANLCQAEVGNPLITQPPSHRESLRRRSIQAGLLFPPPRTNHSSSIPEQPALESLLRRIGISSESVIRPRAEDGGAQGLHEKRIHLSQTLRALGSAVEAPLAHESASADSAFHLLTAALHANSKYEVSLSDPALAQALSGLERDLDELHRGVQGLDMEVLHQRDHTRDRFLARWGA